MAAVTGLAVGAVLTGCGGSKAPAPAAAPAPSSSAPSSAPAGPQRFLQDVRSHPLGNKDLVSTPDTKVLDLGSYMCNASSYGEAVSALVGTDNAQASGVTTEQADFFVRTAITNLCPQQKAMLP